MSDPDGDSDGHLEMACLAISISLGGTIDALRQSGLRMSAVGAAVLREAALVAGRVLTNDGATAAQVESIDAICLHFRRGVEEVVASRRETRH